MNNLSEKRILGPEVRFELKKFFPLLAALWGQQLLSLSVNLLDNFMLGTYMESAMSAASVVNQVQSVVANIIFGAGSGVAMLGAQYWGKGQKEPIKKIFADGLKTSAFIGILMSIITFAIPGPIIRLLTSDEAIVEQGISYLSIMCFSYAVYSFSNVLMVSLQAVETAYVGTIMSGTTLITNGVLNYILIYGNFGAPELGIKGAAIATLASRVIELIIVWSYILFKDKKLRLKIKDLLMIKTGYYKDYIKVAAPLMFTGFMWAFGLAAQTAILGHLSAEAIGANSIAVTVAQVFLVAGYSSASASGVVMGKTVGSGRLELVKPLAKFLQIFCACLGVIMGIILMLLRSTIISVYSISPETTDLASTFLLIMSFSIMGSIYEYPVMGGIIAGGGNTKYQTLMDNLFMWLFSVPFAFLSAYVFHWHPAITFMFLKVDQLLKCIPNAIYCNSYKWVKDWTR